MEGLLTRGWERILPGCGGTSALARGATLAARSLQEPQLSQITQWGWGFHTLRSGIDPGDQRFRPRVDGLEDMKGFLTRGWDLILPGCGGISALSQEASPAA